MTTTSDDELMERVWDILYPGHPTISVPVKGDTE